MPGGSPPGIRPSGKPAGSGRRKGSLDLAERKILTGQMAADLMTVYRRLGGVKWLEKFAREQPAEFLRQGLSRLFPAPDKHDDSVVLNQLNIGGDMSTLESAMRVAFLLAKATHAEPHGTLERVADPVVGPVPAAAAPVDSVANPVPDSAPDPVARDSAWQAMLPPTAAERDAQAATQQASDAHHGGAEEQARPRPPRPGLSNRREELL